MADSWENQYNALSGLASWLDLDGDGWTNLEEYFNGTSPAVADDPMKTTFPFEP